MTLNQPAPLLLNVILKIRNICTNMNTNTCKELHLLMVSLNLKENIVHRQQQQTTHGHRLVE